MECADNTRVIPRIWGEIAEMPWIVIFVESVFSALHLVALWSSQTHSCEVIHRALRFSAIARSVMISACRNEMRSVVDESFFCIAKSPTARSARSYRAWNSRAFHIRSRQQPSVHSCDEPQLPRGSNLLGALYHGAFMTHTAYTPRLSSER